MKKITFKSNNHRIVGILEVANGDKRPGILMFHGLTNTKEDCPLMSQVKETLCLEGYAIFRFDFYGSGESAGQFKDKTISEMVTNAKDALDVLSSNKLVEGENIGLWGRSIGGLVAAMLTRDERVRASVLASAPIFPHKTFYPLYARDPTRDFVPLPQGTVSGKIKGKPELSKAFFTELQEIENKTFQALQGASSILIIQGDHDKKVDPKYARCIYDTVKEPKELLLIKGAGHDYSGKENQVISAVRRWYTNHLPI